MENCTNNEIQSSNVLPNQNLQVNGKLDEIMCKKGLSLEQVLEMASDLVHELEKLEEFHKGEGMKIQKKLGDFYWDYTSWRTAVGDTLSSEGYASITVKMLKSLNTIGIFKNDYVWFPTYYAYNTMWNYSDASTKLSLSFADCDAVRLLTLNCGHKPYISALHSKNVYYIIKASLSILHNIAKNPSIRHFFKDQKTYEVIQPFISSKDEMFKALSMLTMAYIVEEEDNAALIEETGTIQCLLQWLEKALDSNKKRYKGFTPQELVEGLNKLGVNDNNKMKIVDGGILQSLLRMLKHDDVREQISAARMLWTLSFDKSVTEKVLEYEGFTEVLEKLQESKEKKVKANVKGALWILRGGNNVTKLEKNKLGPKHKGHILISYSWGDSEPIMKIRERLKVEGYQVWIDVEHVGGCTLPVMAEAADDSAVVLICMSEKYKQNPHCRTEAEYIFRLRKDYIPLMMQKKYNPDGWLATMLGAKLYFDFSGKVAFEKSFTGLVKELRGRGQHSPITSEEEVTYDGPSSENHDSAIYGVQTSTYEADLNGDGQGMSSVPVMSKEEVSRWLHFHHLDGCVEAFSLFDGRMLLQLNEMRKEAPEFFYHCLEKKLNMTLVDILKFTSALDNMRL